MALASGAYALGSQAGDGSAVAAKDSVTQEVPPRFGGPMAFERGFGNLADELGVSEDELAEAMRAARGGDAPPKPADIQKQLAAALGVSQSDLRAAMKKLGADRGAPGKRDRAMPCGPGGPGPQGGAFFFFGPDSEGAAALANELGIDESKVEDAFDSLRDEREAELKQHHAAFVQKLADELGISVDKVNEALPEPMLERRHP